MNREQMLDVMRKVYADRVKGDVDGMVSALTPDAKFKLNASAPQKAVVYATAGLAGAKSALTQLVNDWEFETCDIVDAVVEGSKAAVRIRFKVKSRKTGNAAVTESLDLVEFEDGKVVSYTQFFDSAIADRLTAVA